MSHITRIDLADDHLQVTVEGDYSLPSSLDVIDQLLEACVTHRASRVLVDHRKEIGNPTTLERYEAMTQAHQKYMKVLSEKKIGPVRFAVLGNVPRMDAHHFGENVAINRGLPLRVFTQESDALEWLRSS